MANFPAVMTSYVHTMMTTTTTNCQTLQQQ